MNSKFEMLYKINFALGINIKTEKQLFIVGLGLKS